MYIGIDIKETFVNYSVINPKGIILEKSFFVTSLTLAELVIELENIISGYKKKYWLSGIGISVPNNVKNNGLKIKEGPISYLEEINLKMLLQTEVNLPIAIEYEGNCLAIAEKWIGNGQSVENFICLKTEEKVIGGIILEGALYHEESLFLNGCNHDTEEVNFFYEYLALEIIRLFEQFKPEVILFGGKRAQKKLILSKIEEQFLRIKSEQKIDSEILTAIIKILKPAKLENDAKMVGAVYLVKKNT